MAITSAAEAFERFYDLEAYPKPSGKIVLTKGVHDHALVVARQLGLSAVDLRKADPVSVFREIEHQRVSALLGRGELDKAFGDQEDGDNVYFSLRHGSEVSVVSRLGNGIDKIDSLRAFGNGIVVEKTPEGNAKAVRIWQDLLLLELLEKDHDRAREKNPAAIDDAQIKSASSLEKHLWDRREVNKAVNPESLPFEQAPPEAKKQAEHLRGKKVAVIGPGRIGQEVIENSVFLKHAKVVAYDIDPERVIDGVTMARSLEEALQDAEVVLLHIDGERQILGEKEFNLLHDGAMVCNVARGKNIDPKALLNALESGKVGAAALDTHAEEGKKLKPFQELPSSRSEWQPGHYAHALRMHPHVVAGNHSAASDEVAQIKNAEDGVRAVHRYLTRGEVVDGVVAPSTVFPYKGFIQEDDRRFSPKPLKRVRFAMELLHDGSIPGILQDTRAALEQHLGMGPKQRLSLGAGELCEGRERNGRVPSIDFFAIDFPDGNLNALEGDDRPQKTWVELAKVAEGMPGVHRARIFVPRRKR